MSVTLAEQIDVNEWITECEVAKNAADLNDLISRLDYQHPNIDTLRRAIYFNGKKLDVTLDREFGGYIDNVYVDPSHGLPVVVGPLKAVHDAILAKLNNAKGEEEIVEAEKDIVLLSSSDRPALFMAAEKVRLSIQSRKAEINKRLTESEYLEAIQQASSVAEIDPLIREMEAHQVPHERNNLLVLANQKRRSITNPSKEFA